MLNPFTARRVLLHRQMCNTFHTTGVIAGVPGDSRTMLKFDLVCDLKGHTCLSFLRACSHGGEGPQVGEVPHLLCMVKTLAFTCNICNPGALGCGFQMLPDCFFYSVRTFPNKSSFFFELFFTVTAHFIQGLFGLSEPFKAKFIKEINR